MTDTGRFLRFATAGLLAWALAPASTIAASSHPASITLITGDRVQLTPLRGGGRERLAVRPAPGREGMAFFQSWTAGPGGVEEVTVVPADAAPLLQAGLLDPQLFNVTALVRQGLGHGGRPGLPLILVTRTRGLLLQGLPAPSVRGTRYLPSIGGQAVVENAASAGAFWGWLTGGNGGARTSADRARALRAARSTGVTKVWLDGRARPLLDESGPQIGVPAARAAGLTGSGVTVAVLDTGIKADHPDLAGTVLEARDFTETSPEATDDVGHGTHVAGIVAGSGAASGGRYEGVAPGVRLLNGKVCETQFCSFSAIIAGMEWAAPRARIINMSLGGSPTDGTDLLSQAVDNLSAQHGTLFVVAAGNAGWPQSISSPASARSALAVGSVTKQDQMSAFSSRGPRVGDLAIKPDLVAPGQAIVAARAAGTPVGDEQPVDDNYTRLSGTSMAAPQVAGAAALLAQRHPSWTGSELKAALMGSARSIEGATVHDQGAGRLDLNRGIVQTVLATPGSLSFGLVPWPQEQAAVTRTITYHNRGDAQVTLQVALSATGSAGQPAPPGMFTVSTNDLTIPAHGSAELSVIFTPVAGTPGFFSGALTATQGALAVRTVFSATQEVESYDVALHVVPRTGTGVWNTAFLVNVETGEVLVLDFDDFDAEGRAGIRTPRGTYDINAMASSQDAADPLGSLVTLVSEPEVAVTSDSRLTLDTRRGRPVSARVDRPSAVRVADSLAISSIVGSGAGGGIGVAGGASDQMFAVPSRAVTGHSYIFEYNSTLASEPLASAGRDDPFVYNLLFYDNGIPAQLAFRARDAELAAIRTDYHVQAAPAAGLRFDAGFTPGVGVAFAVGLDVPLPSRRTEYFSAGRGIEWFHLLAVGDFPFETEITESDQKYRPGRFHVAWNRAPLGPSVSPYTGARRMGDYIVTDVPLFTGNQEDHFDWFTGVSGISGTTSLSRDGQVIGSNDWPCLGEFEVPRNPATYTLSCHADRSVPWSTLATRVDASWTFRDAGPAPESRGLPLLTVRAWGPVDLEDTARAGQPFPLSLHVQRQPGSPASPVSALELDASFDDGVTWRRVPLVRLPSGDRAVALLRHPPSDGFVSLRARASDAEGNSVNQTVIRAYRILLAP